MALTNHPEETTAALRKTDPQLKSVNFDKWTKLASNESLARAKSALEAKKVNVKVFDKASEALEYIKTTIPAGKSVSNSHSTTLEEIGFIEHFKTQKAWVNLHSPIFAEPDPSKQNDLYKKGHAADYFLSSAAAVSEEGDILACDLTGTKVGAFAHSAGHLLLVVGTHKITPTFAEGEKRIHEYALALESARVRIAYKVPGSQVSNFVAIRNPNPFTQEPRVTVVFVKEPLGY